MNIPDFNPSSNDSKRRSKDSPNKSSFLDEKLRLENVNEARKTLIGATSSNSNQWDTSTADVDEYEENHLLNYFLSENADSMNNSMTSPALSYINHNPNNNKNNYNNINNSTSGSGSLVMDKMIEAASSSTLQYPSTPSIQFYSSTPSSSTSSTNNSNQIPGGLTPSLATIQEATQMPMMQRNMLAQPNPYIDNVRKSDKPVQQHQIHQPNIPLSVPSSLVNIPFNNNSDEIRNPATTRLEWFNNSSLLNNCIDRAIANNSNNISNSDELIKVANQEQFLFPDNTSSNSISNTPSDQNNRNNNISSQINAQISESSRNISFTQMAATIAEQHQKYVQERKQMEQEQQQRQTQQQQLVMPQIPNGIMLPPNAVASEGLILSSAAAGSTTAASVKNQARSTTLFFPNVSNTAKSAATVANPITSGLPSNSSKLINSNPNVVNISSNIANNNNTTTSATATTQATESEERRARRLARNRESARLSRRRKKEHLAFLSEKVNKLNESIENLRRERINNMEAELRKLRYEEINKLSSSLGLNNVNKNVGEGGEAKQLIQKILTDMGPNSNLRRGVASSQYSQLRQLFLPQHYQFLLWVSLQSESFFTGAKEQRLQRTTASRVSSKQIGEEITSAQKPGNSKSSFPRNMNDASVNMHPNSFINQWPLFCYELMLSVEQEDKFLQIYKKMKEENEKFQRVRSDARSMSYLISQLRRCLLYQSHVVELKSKTALTKILNPDQTSRLLSWMNEKNRKLYDDVVRGRIQSRNNNCEDENLYKLSEDDDDSLNELCRKLDQSLQFYRSQSKSGGMNSGMFNC